MEEKKENNNKQDICISHTTKSMHRKPHKQNTTKYIQYCWYLISKFMTLRDRKQMKMSNRVENIY